MFAFLILMLFLAVMTDTSNKVLANDNIVESELDTENQLMNEVVSDNVLKN